MNKLKKLKDSSFVIIHKRNNHKLRLYPHHSFDGKIMLDHIRNGITYLKFEAKCLMKPPLSLDYKIHYHKVMVHLLEHLKEVLKDD